MADNKKRGLGKPIKRRDFVQGAATLSTGAASLTAAARLTASSDNTPADNSTAFANTTGQSEYYPPQLTGLRGSHAGAFETAHEMALEGRSNWGQANWINQEEYDLVVVGGGVSGLAAAYFYAQQNPDASILILDNHDDFGGHAKRNEFSINGQTMIGYGGSQSLENPGSYSEVAKKLLTDIGIDRQALSDAYDINFYKKHNLSAATFFDQATFGENKLLKGVIADPSSFIPLAETELSISDFINKMPISEGAKKQFQHLCSADDDQLQDHSIFAEPDYLSSITYKDFLKKHLKVDSVEVLKVLQDLPSGYFGQGIDCIPAMEALGFGLPGINQTSLGSFESLLRKVLSLNTEPYTFHFPDGNATVARLLVKALIPEIGAGDDMRKIATSKFNYSLLDNPKNQNRVRLNSTVVHVQHVNNNKQVSVTYIQDRQHQRVVAKKVVLACYNMVIPHICPELDTPQKQALKSLVKMPLVYTNILLNNWQAFKNLGVGTFFSPGGWHNMAMLDFPVSMGDVQFSATPNDPIIVHMSKAVTVPGLEPKAQSKAGRYQLLAKSYAEIESDVRQQLDGALGAGGFNSSKDIAAITVNRWPHGYAWTPNSAFDHHVEGQMPNEIGRQTVGRIAIANSDAGASAYLDAAIDQAHRAITELS